MAPKKRDPDSERGLVKLYEGSSGADILKLHSRYVRFIYRYEMIKWSILYSN